MFSKIRHWWFMFWWKREARKLANSMRELDRLHKEFIERYD